MYSHIACRTVAKRPRLCYNTPGASGEGRAYGNGYIFKKGAEP